MPCISDCTCQIQIKSPLCIEVQNAIPFQGKQFNLHCMSIRSSVFIQNSYQCHTKSIFLTKLTAKSMKPLSTETNLQYSMSSKRAVQGLFFVCFAANSLLSHVWSLQKKFLTSDKGDHNTTILCTAGLFRSQSSSPGVPAQWCLKILPQGFSFPLTLRRQLC